MDGIRKKACAQMRSLWDGPEVMQPLAIDRYCCDPKICIVHFFFILHRNGPGIHILPNSYRYVNSIVIYSVLIFNILKLQAPQVMRAYIIIILYLYTRLRELCVSNLRQMKKRSMMREGDHIYSRNYRGRRRVPKHTNCIFFN